ncbi:MAG: flagellar regulator YcgR PilZN domain-containing protein [Pseudomonadota bacterium]
MNLGTGVLFRSRIEITRILERLARDRVVLSAEVGDAGQLFLTRLLHVDPGGEFFVLAYSEERRANIALLEQASVVFRGNDKRGRIEFAAAAPSETVFDGDPAVRFTVPQALLRSQQRGHPRFTLPSDASLRCIADSAGVAPFEARIVDISRGGMGGILYGPGVRLPPGTVLRGCKIMVSGGKPIIVDLEVRYTASVVQPDGSLARRSGVKFLGEPKGIDALLNRFVVEFGEDRHNL